MKRTMIMVLVAVSLMTSTTGCSAIGRTVSSTQGDAAGRSVTLDEAEDLGIVVEKDGVLYGYGEES